MTLAEFLAARLDEDEAAAETWRERDLRPLREVEAKRAILAEHAPDEWGDCCSRCASEASEPYEPAFALRWPCPTVRALAAVYSDHPDYQQEWKPA